MRSGGLLGAVLLLACGGEVVAPEPEIVIDPSVKVTGGYRADGALDLVIYLRDQEPVGEPELFYLRRMFDALPVYTFGMYAEEGAALEFWPNLSEAPRITRARWVARADVLTATVTGYGTLTFRRTPGFTWLDNWRGT